MYTNWNVLVAMRNVNIPILAFIKVLWDNGRKLDKKKYVITFGVKSLIGVYVLHFCFQMGPKMISMFKYIF